MKKNSLAIFIIILSISILTSFYFVPNYLWIFIFILSATIYGFLSPLIAARRFYFLATEAPHMALFAVSISIIISRTMGIFEEWVWSVVVAVLLIYMVGYAIEKGVDPDVATSAIVAFSSAGSVISIYYVLSKYSVQYNLWSIILGDPLLTSWRDLYTLLAVALVVISLTLAIYRVNVYMGIDRDYAYVSTKHPWIYSYILYTIVAIASVALLKIVGYVLEHVLLLLPAPMSMVLTSSFREVLLYSVLLALISSIIGLQLSISTNIAPSGAVGIVVLLIYLTLYILKRLRILE